MSVHTRRRRTAGLAVAASLALGVQAVATAGLAAPAHAAPPAEDCAEPFPVADLTSGATVTGLTVVQGTTPTGFTGEVIGVLEDGIAPDVDMIMMDLDMPAFASTGGVWSGMSGSPVYAEDGRLIGAVAYGLSYGASPIAGITPFEDMDDRLAAGAPPRRIAVDGADARTVARSAGISTGQAARGFSQLPTPFGVSGVTPRRLAQVQESGPDFLEKDTYAAGRAAAADAGEESIVAGGNMAASAAYGDVAFSGVGTATSVCDGRVVGFGHPLAFLGSTTLGLHPADALYVQPESVGAPFKVANVAPPVGTVTDDRTTALTGTFGDLPAATDVVSSVSYDGRSRTGSTAVYVPQFLPDVSLYEVLANQDRVVDGPTNGSELMTWRITGTDRGTPFELSSTDRWSGRELVFDTAFDLAEAVALVGGLDGVTIDEVSHEATVDDDVRRHTLTGVDQFRGGRWVRVTSKAPAQGTAGKPLRLRAVLGGTAGARVVPLGAITLPRTSPGRLRLVAQGGDGLYSFATGKTVAAVRSALASEVRHDQLRVQVGTPDKVERGYDEDDFFGFERARRASFVRTRTTAPLDHVVEGLRNLTVRVR